MEADLGRQLHFPRMNCTTALRPGMVLWTTARKAALLPELTVPWEEGLEAAHERKRAKYADLNGDCRQSGWKVKLYPVEVGARGCSETWEPDCTRQPGRYLKWLRK